MHHRHGVSCLCVDTCQQEYLRLCVVLTSVIVDLLALSLGLHRVFVS